MLTGLVVGKFCPLHKGHEALIEFARARCNRLMILSYAKPELPGCAPERREAWLAALFPDTDRLVLDDARLAAACRAARVPTRKLPNDADPAEDHRTFVAWVCGTLLRTVIDRVFTSEDYGDGFAASLAKSFERPVEHVTFDQGRLAVPISGTALRSDPRLHRAYLSEPVRRDLVSRVVLLGGESSGKTALAEALAVRLQTVWVPEYGRELWVERDGALGFDDMEEIARRQVAREEGTVAEAKGWVICDTSPLTTRLYSEEMFGHASPVVIELSKRRYDHVLLCAPDFPFVQDGTRRDAAFRQRQHEWYESALLENDVSYQVVGGSLTARVELVAELVSRAKVATV